MEPMSLIRMTEFMPVHHRQPDRPAPEAKQEIGQRGHTPVRVTAAYLTAGDCPINLADGLAPTPRLRRSIEPAPASIAEGSRP